jgi:hypothetical protein
MIHFELLRDQGILTVTPEGPLQAADFNKLSEVVDPFIETNGNLIGLLIDAPTFPGWQSFGDMVSHFKFVKNHEQHIKKVAVVSDSGFASIMPHVVRHFIHAEIHQFGSSEKVQALAWLNGK